MKYYFNFKPTVIYRKGSRFLLNTSLTILYFIPIILMVYTAVTYINTRKITYICKNSVQLLNNKNKKISSELKQKSIQNLKLSNFEKQYEDYLTVYNTYSMSWAALFADFEKIIPNDVRLTTVKIIPGRIVKISINGKAKTIEGLTGFLKALFNSKKFVNPNLKSQTKASNGNEILFVLEVGYLQGMNGSGKNI